MYHKNRCNRLRMVIVNRKIIVLVKRKTSKIINVNQTNFETPDETSRPCKFPELFGNRDENETRPIPVGNRENAIDVEARKKEKITTKGNDK